MCAFLFVTYLIVFGVCFFFFVALCDFSLMSQTSIHMLMCFTLPGLIWCLSSDNCLIKGQNKCRHFGGGQRFLKSACSSLHACDSRLNVLLVNNEGRLMKNLAATIYWTKLESLTLFTCNKQRNYSVTSGYNVLVCKYLTTKTFWRHSCQQSVAWWVILFFTVYKNKSTRKKREIKK